MSINKLDSSEWILITTALKESWPSDENKVLFLGEWCKLYKDKKHWKSFKSHLSKYHWDNNNKFNNDYKKINQIYENLLVEISKKLNEIHKINLNKEAWRIIIGPWLGVFCQIVFDRWFTIKDANSKYKIKNTICLIHDLEDQIPNDFNIFLNKMISSDIWNHIIYSEIIKSLGISHTESEFYSSKCSTLKKSDKSNLVFKLKRYLRKIIINFTQINSIKDSYFIFNSCLSKRRQILLQLKLGQFPRVWENKEIPFFKLNLEMRKWNLDYPYKLEESVLIEYLNIILRLIPKFIPRSYLEGFEYLNSKKLTSNWPKSPQKIFTTSSQVADDIFKIWAANKIDHGTKLYIGQHGGHYETSKISFLEDHQKLISKIFLGWGSSIKDSKNIGLFVSGQHLFNIKHNQKGKLLFLQNCIPRYSYWMWSCIKNANHWEKYFNFNCELIKNLPSKIKNESCIRIYPKADYQYNQIDRWKEEFGDIAIDYCDQPLKRKLLDTRICISTTNTSTMLFTMAINFPTIIYWQSEFCEIREQSIKYFDELEKVGILQMNHSKAAIHIKNIWDDIDEWWFSKDTQMVRSNFCNKFANVEKNDLTHLSNLLKMK